MSHVVDQLPDVSIVAGRTFARTAPDGMLDGLGDRGVYAQDMRLLRRVEAFRAEPEVGTAGEVAIGTDGCAVRFRMPAVEPGTGVLLVVELDGTDVFEVRSTMLELDDGVGRSGMGLGDARPDARIRMAVDCDGARLVECDGVALSDVPIAADGTPRTASWRWNVDPEESGPVDVCVELRVAWALSSSAQPPEPTGFGELARARQLVVDEWLAERPVAAGEEQVAQILARSTADLASMRIDVEDGELLGGGVPWYLTVFGRDSLLSSWMALPVDPDLAATTLRHLARHQATTYDLATDAEPGKILHEERRGVAALRWHERYYGSIDSTPLFLMLLAEHARWTGSDDLARELEQPAKAAVAWILARLDEDELGLLSYWRRAERGLDVQSWKDSPDSQRDGVGRVASGLIRPLEAQGYAVAALRGAARVAASAWDDGVVGSQWAATARVLERLLVERSLVELPPGRLVADDPRRGGFLAQAVDSAGHAVDSLCSNAGHLLWTESIADPSLRTRVIEQLTSDALDSGWGVRTMSTLDEGHDATSYHCGSVWPHDTALCIAGIARYDRDSAARLARNLFDAAAGSGGSLPEAFSGAPRGDETAPVPLPSTCHPQAWASAAPFLVLRALLGLEPEARSNELASTVTYAPDWLAGLRWTGIHALGARWDVNVGQDGRIDVVRATR